jgi:hypothetical protein
MEKPIRNKRDERKEKRKLQAENQDEDTSKWIPVDNYIIDGG